MSEARQVWDDGRYTVAFYEQSGGSPAPVSDTIIGSGELVVKDDAEVVLDVNPSTRLATSGYTAPDNASITAIKAKTDNLPADPASQAKLTDLHDESFGRWTLDPTADVPAFIQRTPV